MKKSVKKQKKNVPVLRLGDKDGNGCSPLAVFMGIIKRGRSGGKQRDKKKRGTYIETYLRRCFKDSAQPSVSSPIYILVLIFFA